MSTIARTAAEARSNGRAIATICLGMFCLVLNDALAKWLTDHYSPLQIVFLRSLIAVPMIAAIGLMLGGRASLRTSHLRIHAVRGLLAIGAAYTFFQGLKILPLAEATSLAFAAPIFVTALSVPLLRERVGWRRWLAVLVGFVGVLVIVRPGAAAFQPASLLIVAAALFYALFMISARWIRLEENVWTMMFYVALFPLLYSALVVPLIWAPVVLDHMPYVAAMAVVGTVGVTLIGQAFRLSPAAVVAPFDYTALIWASLFGWLIWGELPDIWTYAGAAVIVTSGIYIIIRETRAKQPA